MEHLHVSVERDTLSLCPGWMSQLAEKRARGGVKPPKETNNLPDQQRPKLIQGPIGPGGATRTWALQHPQRSPLLTGPKDPNLPQHNP